MIDVTAAILIEHGRIFLARRHDHDHGGAWEFPGGKVEPGETPEACLAREMAEEFGVTVAVGDHFGDSEYAYARGTIRLRAYFAERLQGEFVAVDHAEWRWVTSEELVDFTFLPADRPLVAALRKHLAPTDGR